MLRFLLFCFTALLKWPLDGAVFPFCVFRSPKLKIDLQNNQLFSSHGLAAIDDLFKWFVKKKKERKKKKT